jgi:hypothetical protein
VQERVADGWVLSAATAQLVTEVAPEKTVARYPVIGVEPSIRMPPLVTAAFQLACKSELTPADELMRVTEKFIGVPASPSGVPCMPSAPP